MLALVQSNRTGTVTGNCQALRWRMCTTSSGVYCNSLHAGHLCLEMPSLDVCIVIATNKCYITGKITEYQYATFRFSKKFNFEQVLLCLAHTNATA